jgi:hypothetical protein
MAAPGWYDDPHAGGGKRWWDGAQWTDHVAAPTAPAARAEPHPPARLAVAAIAALSGVLLIVGSIGTWVSVQTTGPLHIGATRGGLDRDGAITLALAILCLILIGVWAARLGPPPARIAVAAVAAFLGLLGVIIAIADIADVQSNGSAIVEASAGWGLWLCLVASVALLGTMVVAVAGPKLR